MEELLIRLLDDEHGINRGAFRKLYRIVEAMDELENCQYIIDNIRYCEGRVFLPENWNE